jgi:hypothetical protein
MCRMKKTTGDDHGWTSPRSVHSHRRDGSRLRLSSSAPRFFIPFNPGSCKGSTKEEKAARCTKLRRRWYVKNFLKRWWVDPGSKRFDREYDVGTLSEQGFSVGKGSLNLDSLMHGGKGVGYPPFVGRMHGHARSGKDSLRDRETRPDEVRKMLQRVGGELRTALHLGKR